MDLLSYEDQIYLLAYWLRTNFITIEDELSSEIPSRETLKNRVEEALSSEFSVSDSKVVSEILEFWCIR